MGRLSRQAPEIGARQFCDFGLDSAGAPLPAVFGAVAVNRGTERDDGIGAADAPVHSALFQPSADQWLATTLDNDRRHAQTLFPEPGTVRARSIGPEAFDVPRRLIATARVPAQLGDDGIEAPLVEFVASGLAPLRHLLRKGNGSGVLDLLRKRPEKLASGEARPVPGFVRLLLMKICQECRKSVILRARRVLLTAPGFRPCSSVIQLPTSTPKCNTGHFRSERAARVQKMAL